MWPGKTWPQRFPPGRFRAVHRPFPRYSFMTRVATAESEAIDPIALAAGEPLYDRSFALSVAGQTCFVLANTLTTAHFARWVSHLDGGKFDAGLISGVGMAAALLLRPWIGQWINRWGALTVWLCGFAVFGLAAAGNVFVDSLGPLIYILRSFLALGAALVFAASLTYVVQCYPRSRRTEAIGVLGAGGFLGMLVGPQLGDYILGAQERSREDFLFLFVASAVALLAPLILLSLVRRPDVEPVKGSVRLSEFVRTSKTYWPGAILFVIACFGVCMTIPFVFLASFFDDEKIVLGQMSPMGVFFYCYAGWGLTVRLTLRRLPERVGRRKVLLVGMLCMAVGMASYLLVSGERPWMILIPGLICGTAHALMFHTMTSLALERFPSQMRGTGSALALMMLDLGMVVGSPILGWIADNLGFPFLFIAISLCCWAAFSIYLRDSLVVWRERATETAGA